MDYFNKTIADLVVNTATSFTSSINSISGSNNSSSSSNSDSVTTIDGNISSSSSAAAAVPKASLIARARSRSRSRSTSKSGNRLRQATIVTTKTGAVSAATTTTTTTITTTATTGESSLHADSNNQNNNQNNNHNNKNSGALDTMDRFLRENETNLIVQTLVSLEDKTKISRGYLARAALIIIAGYFVFSTTVFNTAMHLFMYGYPSYRSYLLLKRRDTRKADLQAILKYWIFMGLFSTLDLALGSLLPFSIIFKLFLIVQCVLPAGKSATVDFFYDHFVIPVFRIVERNERAQQLNTYLQTIGTNFAANGNDQLSIEEEEEEVEVEGSNAKNRKGAKRRNNAKKQQQAISYEIEEMIDDDEHMD